jgi:pimeloyl-ACP methyl ester carboxylesterase
VPLYPSGAARNRPWLSSRRDGYRAVMPPLVSRWREVDGYRLHVRETGAGAPLVLVHGLGVSGEYLEPLGRVLGRSFGVSIPDLPGWRESEHPRRALTLDQLADVLAELVGPGGRPPAFVANSLGCQIALALAERHPEKVRALILIGPTVDPAYRGWIRHAIRLLVGATRERRGLLPIVLEDYLRMGPRRILATARAALADVPEERLPRICAPVLVVRGARDALTTSGWARRCAALAPRGAFVEIAGAAHAAHVSHPEYVGELVERFLAECDDRVGELVGRVDHRHVTGSGEHDEPRAGERLAPDRSFDGRDDEVASAPDEQRRRGD